MPKTRREPKEDPGPKEYPAPVQPEANSNPKTTRQAPPAKRRRQPSADSSPILAPAGVDALRARLGRPQAMGASTSIPSTPATPRSPKLTTSAKIVSAAGDAGATTSADDQPGDAPGGKTTKEAPPDSTPSSPPRRRRTTQTASPKAGPSDAPHDGVDTHLSNGSAAPGGEPNGPQGPNQRTDPTDAALLIWADALDDLERTRIATENRLRSLAQVKGLSGPREVGRLETLLTDLVALEDQATKGLKHAFTEHKLYPWVRRTVGVGEKQAARLLAAIGDPATRRGPGQLWAYCGLGVVAAHSENEDHEHLGGPAPAPMVEATPKTETVQDVAAARGPAQTPSRSPKPEAATPGDHPSPDDQRGTVAPGGRSIARSMDKGTAPGGPDHGKSDDHPLVVGVAPRHTRGVRSNWNATAKMRVYLIAASCIKHRTSPLRAVYDAGRAKYAEAIHQVACPPCHAKAGEPLRDGHKHARAMRLVMKEILRQLWVEAKEHQEAA